MRIEDGIKLDFQDVLIKPKRSRAPSRSSVQLERTFVSKYAGVEWTGIPIIAANMYGTGTIAMATALSKHHMLTALHKHYSVEDLVNFFDTNRDLWNYVFYTIGINPKDLDKLDEVAYCLPLVNRDEVFPKLLCVDAANFYTEYANDRIKEIRERFPSSILMAGNVVSYEMTEQLILSGVDIVKCGSGSGSVCRTRLVAGVGFPQMSSASECADAAHGLKGLVCSDGGCTCPGDVCKAVGVGCFLGTEKVKTTKGLKLIKDISIGDRVYTHTGKSRSVIKKIKKKNECGYMIKINGINCTPNHEFYVINKADIDNVNDDNIDQYAKWVSASKLTKEHFLINIEN